MSSSHVLQPTLASALWPSKSTTRILRWVVLAVIGTALLTIAAKIKVPFYPVPMTMQTLVVLLIGATYGWRLGGATILLYLAEGAMGLPVFTNTPEKGIGLAYMIGSTGGYLVGFVLAAGLVGWLAQRGWDRSPVSMLAAMTLGTAVILAFGVAWLAYLIGFDKALTFGLYPFLWGAVLKIALGTAIVPMAWTAVRRFKNQD